MVKMAGRPRLPKGEETLPIIEVEGRFLTLEELQREYPELYKELTEKKRLGISPALTVPEELLIERVKLRHAQGRVPTIYRLQPPYELTPEEQIWHMEQRTEIGLQLIEAERKLLEEELKILGLI